MRATIAAIWAAWAIYQIVQVFRRRRTGERIGFILGALLSAITSYLLMAP